MSRSLYLPSQCLDNWVAQPHLEHSVKPQRVLMVCVFFCGRHRFKISGFKVGLEFGYPIFLVINGLSAKNHSDMQCRYKNSMPVLCAGMAIWTSHTDSSALFNTNSFRHPWKLVLQALTSYSGFHAKFSGILLWIQITTQIPKVHLRHLNGLLTSCLSMWLNINTNGQWQKINK